MYHPSGFLDSSHIIIVNNIPYFHYTGDNDHNTYVHKLKHHMSLDVFFQMDTVPMHMTINPTDSSPFNESTQSTPYNDMYYYSMRLDELQPDTNKNNNKKKEYTKKEKKEKKETNHTKKKKTNKKNKKGRIRHRIADYEQHSEDEQPKEKNDEPKEEMDEYEYEQMLYEFIMKNM